MADSQGLTSGCGGTGKYKAAPGAGNCTACEAGMAAHERYDAHCAGCLNEIRALLLCLRVVLEGS